MTSPFKGLAEQSKSQQIETSEKLASSHKTTGRFTKDDIRNWISTIKPKKSSICALLIGHPKIGKSGVMLDCRTDEEVLEGKKLMVFEMNSDNGCDVNNNIFHNSDPNIIIINPREYIQDKDGKWVLDYIASMEKIKATIQTIKEDYESQLLDIKAVCFDGLDIFLSEFCEAQMRLDEHIDAAGGVAMRFWKNRNKFYYDVINMILDIDVDKYFITHYAPRTRDDKTGVYKDNRTVSKIDQNLVYACQKSTTDKMHQIIEFTDETRVISGKKKIKIIATMIGDRRSMDNYMETITIAETGDDGKIKWNGKCLLDRSWR